MCMWDTHQNIHQHTQVHMHLHMHLQSCRGGMPSNHITQRLSKHLRIYAWTPECVKTCDSKYWIHVENPKTVYHLRNSHTTHMYQFLENYNEILRIQMMFKGGIQLKMKNRPGSGGTHLKSSTQEAEAGGPRWVWGQSGVQSKPGLWRTLVLTEM